MLAQDEQGTGPAYVFYLGRFAGCHEKCHWDLEASGPNYFLDIFSLVEWLPSERNTGSSLSSVTCALKWEQGNLGGSVS